MLLLDLVMGNYKQNSIESRFAIRCVYDVLQEDWKSHLYHKVFILNMFIKMKKKFHLYTSENIGMNMKEQFRR